MVRSKIKILYLTKPYKHYSSASYQSEFIKYMKRFFDVNIFEIGTDYHKVRDPLTLELKKLRLKKISQNYDILMFGHHWLGDHHNENIIPLDMDFLSEINLVKIAVLNKEYARLNEKIEYFQQIGCSYLISHHSSLGELFTKKSISTNMEILQCIFALDEDLWNGCSIFPNKKRKYDLSFSGVLVNKNWGCEYQSLRAEIESVLFLKFGSVRVISKYKGIYWNSFTGNKYIDELNRYKRLKHDDYKSCLYNSKAVLSTLSMDIITPRLFESMACGAVPLINNSKRFKIIDNIESHTVTFNPNLTGFLTDMHNAVDLGSDPIVNKRNRDFVMDCHTWSNRFSNLQRKFNSIE
jgi:hypothetical protein